MQIRHFLITGLVFISAFGTGQFLIKNLAAQSAGPEDFGKKERCALRVGLVFRGLAPTPEALAAMDPQSGLGALMASPEFIEKFARFVNARYNDEPGASVAEDSAYHLSRYILQNNRPWHELFDGPYDVQRKGNGQNQAAIVVENPEGLGYFRSEPWLLRYAGNELQGLKLNTAYRIMHNVVGLRLTATTNAPGADVSATGRQSAACRSCHYDGWYALDKTAQVLSRVQRDKDAISFVPPDGQPRALLGGVMIADDKGLVQNLIQSENFAFASCRLAFNFLYARDESSCESTVFDRCMNDFKKSGMIQSALTAIAQDPSFCQ